MKLRINNKGKKVIRAMADNGIFMDFVLIYPGQSLVIEEVELERTECTKAETCVKCDGCYKGGQ
jgi:hypothetical protein